jgi:hypothetical protein
MALFGDLWLLQLYQFNYCRDIFQILILSMTQSGFKTPLQNVITNYELFNNPLFWLN